MRIIHTGLHGSIRFIQLVLKPDPHAVKFFDLMPDSILPPASSQLNDDPGSNTIRLSFRRNHISLGHCAK